MRHAWLRYDPWRFRVISAAHQNLRATGMAARLRLPTSQSGSNSRRASEKSALAERGVFSSGNFLKWVRFAVDAPAPETFNNFIQPSQPHDSAKPGSKSLKTVMLIKLRRRVFGRPAKSVNFQPRGCRGASPFMQNRLEGVGHAFLAGYHVAVECSSSAELDATLAAGDLDLRGFAFEGAAMGLALLEF